MSAPGAGHGSTSFERVATGRWRVKASEMSTPAAGGTVELILAAGDVLLRLGDGREMRAAYRDCYFYGGGRRNLKLAIGGSTLTLESLDGADGGRIEKIGLSRRESDARANAGTVVRPEVGITRDVDGTLSFWGIVLASSQLASVHDGGTCHVSFGGDAIRIASRPGSGSGDVIRYAEVTHLQVGGRGALTETTGGGFIGGGFGVEGAVEGMLMASALNALTTRTRTSIETIVDIAAGPRAVLLLTQDEPPDLLRTHLSPAFASIQQAHLAAAVSAATVPAADRLAQLKTLGELRDAGVLTAEEFEAEKARVLRS